jgi:hypothetical protein
VGDGGGGGAPNFDNAALGWHQLAVANPAAIATRDGERRVAQGKQRSRRRVERTTGGRR